MTKNLKSSAILIALFSGTILTAVLTLSVLSSQASILKVIKNNNLEIAKSAARSGLDEAMANYKEAVSNNKNIYENQPKVSKIEGADDLICSYQVKIDSLSYGSDFEKSDWLDDSSVAQKQNALVMKNNDELNIDLSYFSKALKDEDKPTELELKFSNLFKESKTVERESSDVSAKLSYLLIDQSKKDKLISKSDIQLKDSHQFKIIGLQNCLAKESNCLLNIKVTINKERDFLFLKTQSKVNTKIIPSSENKPGTLIIKSIGEYKGEKVKLEAKYSDYRGQFLGIFYPVIK